MGTGLIAVLILSSTAVAEHGFNLGGPGIAYLLRQSGEVRQLYRDGGHVVAPAMLDYNQAAEQCPNGFDVRRQQVVAEAEKDYLVTSIKCR